MECRHLNFWLNLTLEIVYLFRILCLNFCCISSMARSKWCEHRQLNWIWWEKGGSLVWKAHMSFLNKWRSVFPPYRVFLPLPPTSYPCPGMGLEHSAAQKIVTKLFTWLVSKLSWFWTNLSHEERMVTIAAGFTRSRYVHAQQSQAKTYKAPTTASPMPEWSYLSTLLRLSPRSASVTFLPCELLELSSDPPYFIPSPARRCYHHKMGR